MNFLKNLTSSLPPEGFKPDQVQLTHLVGSNLL